MPSRNRGEVLPEDEDHQAGEEALRAEEKDQWDVFRVCYPARFDLKKRMRRRMFGRPNPDMQSDWCVYTRKVENSRTKIQQQHLIVPLLVPHSQKDPTQPLADNDLTAPWQGHGRNSGKEHVTNIFRMEFLLKEHPGVEIVNRYKEEKR